MPGMREADAVAGDGAPAPPVPRDLVRALVDAGHLMPLGVPGLYAQGGAFEEVVAGIQAAVTRAGADLGAEVLHFPPVFSREAYGRTGHVRTMPQLLGSVHCFSPETLRDPGIVRRLQKGEEWTEHLQPAEMVLPPAACYPLYPTATGTLGPEGRTVDLVTCVFRNEPSDDPARMQSFRMREYVRLGTAGQATAHRDEWLRRAATLLRGLGLDVTIDRANDPFMGRGGMVMTSAQRDEERKYELLCPITSATRLTAVASCNYHVDHFGRAFDIRTADGGVAHSACVGFGLERVALALLSRHGMHPAAWPAEVRAELGL